MLVLGLVFLSSVFFFQSYARFKHGFNYSSHLALFLGFHILVLQLGHNIEKVREKMRELTKQIVNFYSATKTLPYILEGLRSKNNRTRIECVDLVGFLIDHHGAEVQEGGFILFYPFECSLENLHLFPFL